MSDRYRLEWNEEDGCFRGEVRLDGNPVRVILFPQSTDSNLAIEEAEFVITASIKTEADAKRFASDELLEDYNRTHPNDPVAHDEFVDNLSLEFMVFYASKQRLCLGFRHGLLYQNCLLQIGGLVVVKSDVPGEFDHASWMTEPDIYESHWLGDNADARSERLRGLRSTSRIIGNRSLRNSHPHVVIFRVSHARPFDRMYEIDDLLADVLDGFNEDSPHILDSKEVGGRFVDVIFASQKPDTAFELGKRKIDDLGLTDSLTVAICTTGGPLKVVFPADSNEDFRLFPEEE